MTDIELLQQYAHAASQDAFAQLVQRHYGWVRAAAQRQVRSSALADDVAQAVFMVLAQKARSLPPSTSLPSWLFQVVRYASSNALRSERRRRTHERKAAEMHIAASENPAPPWQHLAADLDTLVARLRSQQRQALLLRFYQQLTFAEMGAALGVSEDAARKRVDHALAKLRTLYEGRRITVPVTALASAMAIHTAGAPVEASLAASVTLTATGAAPAGAAVATLAAQTLHALTFALVKTPAMIAAVLLLLIAAYKNGDAVRFTTPAKTGTDTVLAPQKRTASPLLASPEQPFNPLTLDPARGVAFQSSMWWSSWWAGAGPFGKDNDTQAAALDLSGPSPRFIVGDPGKWHVWVTPLSTPIDPQIYPILRVQYRATNMVADFAPSRYVIWMDDGTGPNNGGLYYFPPTSIRSDGQLHTFTADMRKRDTRTRHPTGPITEMALGVGCEAKRADPTDVTPATFELVSLRFETPDGTGANAAPTTPLHDDRPISVKVTDSESHAVAAALVTVDPDRLNFARATKTDAAGLATLTPLKNETGEHRLRVEKDGLCPAEIAVANAHEDFTLERAVRYSGVVRDRHGNPISGAFVGINNNTSVNDSLSPTWSQTITNDDGRWQSAPLPENLALKLTVALSGWPDLTQESTPVDLKPLLDGTHVTTFGVQVNK